MDMIFKLTILLLCLVYIGKVACDDDDQIYCDDNNQKTNDTIGELFSYRHITKYNNTFDIISSGKPFNCSFLPLLIDLQLTSGTPPLPDVTPTRFPEKLTFVLAADAKYFNPLVVSFSTIIKQFGTEHRYIVYDLGDLKEKYETELKDFCKIEYRMFNYSKYPAFVRDPEIFSWKILATAEVFMEDNVIDMFYLDTSTYFKSSDFGELFRKMSDKNHTMASVQLNRYADHPFKMTTDKKMYDYLPFDLNIFMEAKMFEAGLLYIHKNEQSRQLLKWAVLCALIEECIDPAVPKFDCVFNGSQGRKASACNRHDQSVLNILTRNLEIDLQNQGNPTIAREDGNTLMTAGWLGQRVDVRRGQQPKGDEIITCDGRKLPWLKSTSTTTSTTNFNTDHQKLPPIIMLVYFASIF